MQSAIGGSKDMSLTVSLVGPMWVVKNAPGTADFARFYKAAAAKGFIFTDPRAAKAQPGQAKAMAEMYNQMAALDGIPYETEMQIKMILARMGNLTMASVTDSVETAPLADDLFAPPAGYKLNAKK